jgi:hypothetical protein
VNTGFRVALGGYVVLFLAIAGMALFLGPRAMPEPAAIYINWWNNQPPSQIESLVYFVSLGAGFLSLLAAGGMAFFATWSRHLFAASLVVLIAGEGFVTLPLIKSGFEYQMDTILGVLAGGIVAMSYWSPLAARFHAKSP